LAGSHVVGRFNCKKVTETVQASKIAELELVAAAQAKRIAELERVSTNLKLEIENVTAGYQRLAEKYKRLEEKANALERKKTNMAEVHTTKPAQVVERLTKEMQDYMDYHWDVRHNIRELHKVLKASLGEVGACCLPFPSESASRPPSGFWCLNGKTIKELMSFCYV
jgi:uncharacterized coiled-coil protein SlyX